MHVSEDRQRESFIVTSLEVGTIQFGAIVFWLIFWILNAVDKIAAGSPYWAGRMRYESMHAYWSSINLDFPWVVISSLVVIGILELIAGILFIIALYHFIRRCKNLTHRFFFWGTATGILIFGGFIMFDVIVGDRAELLEHTTYWAVIMLSWLVYVSSEKFHRRYSIK